MNTERLATGTGMASGATSILGSWQVCHNLCLGLIALLSVAGITVTGMPLLFLTEIATPMWWAALVLLAATGAMHYAKRCIPRGLLVANAGLVIAGTPYLAANQPAFWTIGGLLAGAGGALYITDRKNNRKEKDTCHTKKTSSCCEEKH